MFELVFEIVFELVFELGAGIAQKRLCRAFRHAASRAAAEHCLGIRLAFEVALSGSPLSAQVQGYAAELEPRVLIKFRRPAHGSESQ